MRLTAKGTLRRLLLLSSLGAFFWFAVRYLRLSIDYDDQPTVWMNTLQRQDTISSVQPLRRNLIIVGYDRSGTTFTTQVFNNDPQMFTIYEPLWFPTDWMSSEDKPANHTLAILEVIDSILSCKFNTSDTRKRFVNSIALTRDRIRMSSNALMKPPFCQDSHTYSTCTSIDENVLTEQCVNAYKHSVLKVASLRFPDRYVSSLQEALRNPEVDTRILHLVRDPRPNINSRIKAGWFPSLLDKPVSTFSKWCKASCLDVQRNIEFFKNAPDWVKNRYKLVRYDDMMRDPVKTFEDIYEFAGFDLPEVVRNWIRKSTNPSKEDMEKNKNNKLAVVRNAQENIDKWMNSSLPIQIKIIEENCQPLMKLLGYKSVYVTDS